MDLNICIVTEDERSWERRSKRLQTLILTIPHVHEDPESTISQDNFILVELQKAAEEASADYFIDELERISTEKKVPLSTILNQVGPSGNSLLHSAISFGKEEIAQLIAFHFPYLISKRNVKGDTALHIAARIGMLSTIEILVCCAKEFPTATDNNSGNNGLLRTKNVHGNTALHEAVMNCHCDVVQFIVSADPELWYYENKQGLSPLNLAIKTGDVETFRLLLKAHPIGHDFSLKRLQGNPPAYIAFINGRQDMLEEMAKVKPNLLSLKDGKGRSVLHWAAYAGIVDTVLFISSRFKNSMFEMDNDGFLPIHIASQQGHEEVIKVLLKLWPYPTELLNKEGQNILHVASKSGKNKVVKYILGNPIMEKLLNEKDINGNTALHLAAMHSHPAVVLTLTWESRINLHLQNNESLTAFDVSPKVSSSPVPRLQYRLTNAALLSAGAGGSMDLMVNKQMGKFSEQMNPVKFQYIKERVPILLLLETLVATVTFAAAFTLPSGYNSDSPDKGIAIMLHKPMFQLFVICNTVAFYSSIISMFCIYWTTLSDIYFVLFLYRLSLTLFGLALGMISLAFIAAVHLAVSPLAWLASYILLLGISSFLILLLMFTVCTFPIKLNLLFMRYISYYISHLLILLLGNYDVVPVDKAEDFQHLKRIGSKTSLNSTLNQ
ncbi:protein ACCELERATED CELL DEATH 6-like [Euphorbia lathyris]|uniref:protein ACCELERATED CELL DEATH 6-like n=1 Tax=Euphorbia lathyris TaxID=212925 RepID=UPI00331408FE